MHTQKEDQHIQSEKLFSMQFEVPDPEHKIEKLFKKYQSHNYVLKD